MKTENQKQKQKSKQSRAQGRMKRATVEEALYRRSPILRRSPMWAQLAMTDIQTQRPGNSMDKVAWQGSREVTSMASDALHSARQSRSIPMLVSMPFSNRSDARQAAAWWVEDPVATQSDARYPEAVLVLARCAADRMVHPRYPAAAVRHHLRHQEAALAAAAAGHKSGVTAMAHRQSDAPDRPEADRHRGRPASVHRRH